MNGVEPRASVFDRYGPVLMKRHYRWAGRRLRRNDLGSTDLKIWNVYFPASRCSSAMSTVERRIS